MILFDDMTLDMARPVSSPVAPLGADQCPGGQPGRLGPSPLSTEDEARVPKDLDAPYPGEALVTAPAGAAAILNSFGWHSGTPQGYRRTATRSISARPSRSAAAARPVDHLTEPLFERLSPAQRYLMEIEPPNDGDGILRHPKRAQRGWWN